MKKRLTILLLVAFICVLAACSTQTSAPEDGAYNSEVAALSVGEDFKLGDENYALEKWVLCTEYDTDTQIGVGLCFLQKEGVAPIAISGGSYQSLIDMTLDMDGEKLATSNISFVSVEDVPGYTARITFEFVIPKGEDLPTEGTIFHTGENEEIMIDLSGLEALPMDVSQGTEDSVREVAALDDVGKALCGEWLLDSIIFCTTDADNGIYTIDAEMNISEGFKYGRDLVLNDDMTMVSLVDLSAMIDAVDELPFTINNLDLKDYSGWTYSGETISLTYGGPEFTVVYDAASKEMSLTHSSEVEIISNTTNGMATQSGSVLIDITMVFKAK